MSLRLADDCTEHYPGSIDDVETFRQKSEFHSKASKTYVWERNYDDKGLLEHRTDAFWAILADKDYQSASDSLHIIQFIRAPTRRVLTSGQLEFKRKVLSDHTIFESYFGSVTSLWTILAQKFRYNESIYDNVCLFCLAMKTCHVRSHPLPETDNARFVGVRIASGLHMLVRQKNVEILRREISHAVFNVGGALTIVVNSTIAILIHDEWSVVNKKDHTLFL